MKKCLCSCSNSTKVLSRLTGSRGIPKMKNESLVIHFTCIPIYSLFPIEITTFLLDFVIVFSIKRMEEPYV